jgi:phosphoribosylformimino-5-aminoimidazole carboxamide ribotide isomerase
MHDAVPTPVIASGGVTTADDVQKLAEIGVAGCIIGRTLYDGKLTVAEAVQAAQIGR